MAALVGVPPGLLAHFTMLSMSPSMCLKRAAFTRASASACLELSRAGLRALISCSHRHSYFKVQIVQHIVMGDSRHRNRKGTIRSSSISEACRFWRLSAWACCSSAICRCFLSWASAESLACCSDISTACLSSASCRHPKSSSARPATLKPRAKAQKEEHLLSRQQPVLEAASGGFCLLELL